MDQMEFGWLPCSEVPLANFKKKKCIMAYLRNEDEALQTEGTEGNSGIPDFGTTPQDCI